MSKNKYIDFMEPPRDWKDDGNIHSFFAFFNDRKIKNEILIPVFQRNYSWNDEEVSDFTIPFKKYFDAFFKRQSRDISYINKKRYDFLIPINNENTFLGSMYIAPNLDND
ncbi:hypothetical protein [Spiroplasma endosymbiont of Labia minor]|uniref:hypothetical protein n=1 Tax=Spiroplasma endosymbiont of Labia minor TaxID=3066305 RepID=UPI0030D187CD